MPFCLTNLRFSKWVRLRFSPPISVRLVSEAPPTLRAFSRITARCRFHCVWRNSNQSWKTRPLLVDEKWTSGQRIWTKGRIALLYVVPLLTIESAYNETSNSFQCARQPQNCPFPWGISRPPFNTSGPHESNPTPPKRHLGLAVFAQYVSVTNRQTDRHTATLHVTFAAISVVWYMHSVHEIRPKTLVMHLSTVYTVGSISSDSLENDCRSATAWRWFCFHRRLSVCLFVNEMTQEVIGGFSWNLGKR